MLSALNLKHRPHFDEEGLDLQLSCLPFESSLLWQNEVNSEFRIKPEHTAGVSCALTG